jgi:DeoR/GlpR family transcriptional regulator of sugar metabolism
VNPKWHYKIKKFNVKIAVMSSNGQHENKNFTKKKVLILQSVAKIAEQKLEQTLMVDKVEIADQDSPLASHAQNVEHRTRFLSNQEVINQFFAGIVSANNENHPDNGLF